MTTLTAPAELPIRLHYSGGAHRLEVPTWCLRVLGKHVAGGYAVRGLETSPLPKPRPVVILPAGFTALALYGDQLVTEVVDRYAGELVSATKAVDAGARGASPMWMRDAALAARDR